MSKGSRQRKTDAQKFGENFDAIFRKKEQEQVCSYPFCNCVGTSMNWGKCVQGLPCKKEEK